MAGAGWRAALRTPTGVAAIAAFLVIVSMAVAGTTVFGQAAGTFHVEIARQGPSTAHWFGTDALGRDVLSRVAVATRLSVVLALLATAVGVLGGTLLGILPIVLPARVGRTVTASVDLAVAFPGLLVALALAVVLGVGARGAVLALGVAGIPQFARLTENLASGIASSDYIAAARLAGASRGRLLTRHVLPNIGEPLIINAALGAGSALLAFAGLSFLGLGVQPPSYDWGRLLFEGLNHIYDAPVAALAPGVAVVFTSIAFSLLGETAAQVLGVRTSTFKRYADAPPPPPRGFDDSGAHRGKELILDVEGMDVALPGDNGWFKPVEGANVSIRRGEIVGIVGESGSGKSLMALGLMGLLPAHARTTASKAEFLGRDILTMSDRGRRTLFGTAAAMVFQDPMSSLNPALRIGRQLAEVAEVHLGSSRQQAASEAISRLIEVRISSPKRRVRQYPHEFSGGMRQRVMIAMGLMGRPRLLIADEPTTALDVTVQKQVLALLRAVRDQHDVAVLMISHDIAVVSDLCERVLVMYAGTVVEEGSVRDLLDRPAHPYTRALLDSVPSLTTPRDEPLATIAGRPPDPADKPLGCAFAPRCPRAQPRCLSERPLLVPGVVTAVACHFPHAYSPDSALAGSAGDVG